MLPRWISDALLVGAGGFAGSALRYGVSGFMHRVFPFATFPIGTVTVNVLGCLVIGWLGGLAETRQLFAPATRLVLMLGVLGGFTTYSSFAYETMQLVRDGETSFALGNVLLHVGLGLVAVWIGLGLARAW